MCHMGTPQGHAPIGAGVEVLWSVKVCYIYMYFSQLLHDML